MLNSVFDNLFQVKWAVEDIPPDSVVVYDGPACRLAQRGDEMNRCVGVATCGGTRGRGMFIQTLGWSNVRTA